MANNKSRKTKPKKNVRQTVAVQKNKNGGDLDQPVKNAGTSNISQTVNGKGGNAAFTGSNPTISSDHYTYVNKDLISIGIIGGSLIIILVLLTFILG